MAYIKYRCRHCGAIKNRTESQGRPDDSYCSKKDPNGNRQYHQWERVG